MLVYPQHFTSDTHAESGLSPSPRNAAEDTCWVPYKIVNTHSDCYSCAKCFIFYMSRMDFIIVTVVRKQISNTKADWTYIR